MTQRGDAALCGGLALLIALLALASLMTGPAALTPAQVLQGLANGQGTAGLILREIRLPRLLLSLETGAILALSGAALQGLMRNPLAEPAVFGAPQAAAFGAVVVLYSGLANALSFALPGAAITMAALSVAGVVLLAGRGAPLVSLVLCGLAIGTLAGAATSLAINLSPNPFAVTEIVFWLMGSFEDRSMRHVWLASPFVLVAMILLLRSGRGLQALTLGEDTALTLGVDVARLRWIIIAAVALGVGASVAVAGAIGFVGLVAPHLVRPLVGGDPRRVLLPATLTGAALLTAADIGVRLVPASSEIRVGVVTAVLGVPLFLWLVLTRRAFFASEAA